MEYTGGLIDNRKVKKDYSHLEIGRSSIPTYLSRAKARKVEKLYEKRDQKSTSSCGAHAGELALSIDTGFKHEPAFLYRLRKNYPAEGMYHYDIGEILLKQGCVEDLKITKTEKDYNAYSPSDLHYTIASHFKGKSFVVLEDNKFTIDDIAYIVNDLKRPLILFVFWNGKEWSSDYPKAEGELTNINAQYRHYVTVLPNSAYIYKKKKYVIIQDSSWFGRENIRHLDEDWINKRIYTGLYQQDLFVEEQTKFRHKGFVFTRDLQFGDSGQDVIVLQETLQDLGLFPINISATGYFGGITRQAVKDFQKKHEESILWKIGLKLPTGYFGKSSRAVLNSYIQ
jgi:hypothetical protein